MNTLFIEIGGSGCEAVIGTIPQRVVWYWQQKFEDYQYEHLQWYLTDRYDYEKEHTVPKMFEIEQEYWHDIDDVLHANGNNINGTGFLEVKDSDTKEVIFDGSLNDICNAKNILTETSVATIPDGQSLFYAWTEEKMYSVYCLQTDNPFDINKLSFITDPFKGDHIVSDLSYDGETLFRVDCDGYTKCLNMDINYWGTDYPQ